VVRQTAECFLDNEAGMLTGRFDTPLVKLIASADMVAAMKRLGRERVYVAPQVLEIEAAGFRVLGGLLEMFVQAVEEVASAKDAASASAQTLLRLLPPQFLGDDGQPDADPYARLIQLTDFVSGMTDSHAVSLYKKLTGISLPGG
jgi:dGTPase